MERLKRRIAAWQHFLKGESPLLQTLLFMLPVSWRPRKAFSTMLMGKPFIVPANEDMEGFLGLKREVIDQDGYRTDLIEDNATVIDAGANIGIFAIAAALRRPSATIYAFEPTPETFEALKENTKPYPNIKAFNYGLGDKNEDASIIIGKRSGANKIGEGGIPVKIRTIDSFNIPAKFIKIDTEGYEGKIMKGAAKTIAAHKPIIVMSAYHKSDDKTELPRILNEIAPYECEIHNTYEEDFLCKPKGVDKRISS